jgi:flagellar basal-body rod protein FlgC
MNPMSSLSNLIPGGRLAGLALTAEQARIEVIGQNIANARTTRTASGGPYQRQQVRFSEAIRVAQSGPGQAASVASPAWQVVQDPRPPVMVHQEGHPDADASGMVAYPAINIHEEMADLMLANRAYEANLAVIRNGRALAQQALSIGRR